MVVVVAVVVVVVVVAAAAVVVVVVVVVVEGVGVSSRASAKPLSSVGAHKTCMLLTSLTFQLIMFTPGIMSI